MQTIDTFLTFLVDSCQMDVMDFAVKMIDFAVVGGGDGLKVDSGTLLPEVAWWCSQVLLHIAHKIA